jgi:hypothetical protein
MPSSPQDQHRYERTELRAPALTLVTGAGCFLIFAAITVISNLFPNPTVTAWTTTTFVVFASLGALIFVGALVERHSISAEGVSSRTMFGIGKVATWAEISKAGYNPGMQWFYLRTTGGKVLRLSAMLVGLPKFAEMSLAHLPPSAVDPELRSLLRLIAEGQTQEQPR